MTQTYFLRLLPPRPTFVQDMSDGERALMQRHAEYAKAKFEAGVILLYGPVFDPAGSFGVAVIQADSEEEVERFIAKDPTVVAGLTRYTYAPMMLGGAQAPHS